MEANQYYMTEAATEAGEHLISVRVAVVVREGDQCQCGSLWESLSS